MNAYPRPHLRTEVCKCHFFRCVKAEADCVGEAFKHWGEWILNTCIYKFCHCQFRECRRDHVKPPINTPQNEIARTGAATNLSSRYTQRQLNILKWLAGDPGT